MDRRSKRQKLEAMANQSVSPKEADIAKKKLDVLPPDPPQSHITIVFKFNGNITTVFTVK